MTKSKAAFLLSVQQLARLMPTNSGQLKLWTFTLPAVLSVKDAKKRWDCFLAIMHRAWPYFRGLRVFELHDHHGLHVHLLTDHWVWVGQMRELAQRAGWGRVHVKKLPVEQAGSYLAKDFGRRAKCLKGWRLWAGIGQWNWTKATNVVSDTPFARIYKACKERFSWTGNCDFFERVRKVNAILRRTILKGWADGLGPGGRPYSDFDIFQLLGMDPQFEVAQSCR